MDEIHTANEANVRLGGGIARKLPAAAIAPRQPDQVQPFLIVGKQPGELDGSHVAPGQATVAR